MENEIENNKLANLEMSLLFQVTKYCSGQELCQLQSVEYHKDEHDPYTWQLQ